MVIEFYLANLKAHLYNQTNFDFDTLFQFGFAIKLDVHMHYVYF